MRRARIHLAQVSPRILRRSTWQRSWWRRWGLARQPHWRLPGKCPFLIAPFADLASCARAISISMLVVCVRPCPHHPILIFMQPDTAETALWADIARVPIPFHGIAVGDPFSEA